jgi:hypothetical protein
MRAAVITCNNFPFIKATSINHRTYEAFNLIADNEMRTLGNGGGCGEEEAAEHS